jgi:hypothetical protein
MTSVADIVSSPSLSHEEKLTSLRSLIQQVIATNALEDLITFISFRMLSMEYFTVHQVFLVLDKAGESNPITSPIVTDFVNSIQHISNDDILEYGNGISLVD